jgi:hypothetical protein
MLSSRAFAEEGRLSQQNPAGKGGSYIKVSPSDWVKTG